MIGDKEFKIYDFIFAKGAFDTKRSSHSLMMNLRVYILDGFIVLAVLLMIFPLKYTKAFKTKLTSFYNNFKAKFFWNGAIRTITVMYIQLAMTFANQIKISIYEGGLEQNPVDKFISIFMFVALFGYPFIAWFAIIHNEKNLNNEETKKKMVNLYADIRIREDDPDRAWNIAYYPNFLIRRIMFVAFPTFLWVFPYFQIQCLIMFTSLYIIFYAGTKPHNSRDRRYMEVFNEVLIMIACYHLICFSEFNLSPIAQFNTGYSYVVVFAVAVIVNIGVIVAKQVANLRRMRKFKIIKKARLDVFIARRKLNQQNYAKQFGIDDVKYYEGKGQFVGLPALSASQPNFVEQKTPVVQEAQGTQNLRHLSKIKIQ